MPANSHLVPASPVFMAIEAMDDARVRLLSNNRPIHTSSLLNAVCNVWVRYRGAGHDFDRSELADTCSKIYAAMWEQSHWLVDSSGLMGLHPDFDQTRSKAEVRTLFALWPKYSIARKR